MLRHFIVTFLDALFFFFNDTATTEIYTLSLHDALPICFSSPFHLDTGPTAWVTPVYPYLVALVFRLFDSYSAASAIDRKSTRLNSSHSQISYAVFCLKKKTQTRSK